MKKEYDILTGVLNSSVTGKVATDKFADKSKPHTWLIDTRDNTIFNRAGISGIYSASYYEKIIRATSNLGLTGVPELVIKDKEDDLQTLAIKRFPFADESGDVGSKFHAQALNKTVIPQKREVWIDGYKTAQSQKYSEDDVRRAIGLALLIDENNFNLHKYNSIEIIKLLRAAATKLLIDTETAEETFI